MLEGIKMKMKKSVRGLLSASAGLLVGGFTTYMLVNAALENQRNEGVLTPHQNHLFYGECSSKCVTQ